MEEKTASTIAMEHHRKDIAAKRSLGIDPHGSLPRCGHWSRAKAEKLAKEGDPSHLERGHICDQCACTNVAGKGTSENTKIGSHYGVGWCYIHEKAHNATQCQERVDLMTSLIRQGFPQKFQYRSANDSLAKIYKAEEDGLVQTDMRDNQMLLINMVQQVLDCFEGGDKPNGAKFTGGTNKFGDLTDATDVQMAMVIDRFMNTMIKAAKMQLEITSSDYCHQDEVKVFFGQIMRIVQNAVSQDQLDAIMKAVMEVEQPRTGKRRVNK